MVLVVRTNINPEVGPPALSLDLHKVIMSSSPAFDMLLGRTPFETHLKTQVELRVEEADLAALQLMIQCMYSPVSLPGDMIGAGDAVVLLRAFHLGIMYQIPNACMLLICTFMAALDFSQVDSTKLMELYGSVPIPIYEDPHLHEFMGRMELRLVQLFGDTRAVITQPQLMEQFCRLPSAAVLAWSLNEDLKLVTEDVTEDSVLYILSRWVKSQDAEALDRGFLDQLISRGVRVRYLSPFYLHFVLPNLDWIPRSNLSRIQQMQFQQCYSPSQPVMVYEDSCRWLRQRRRFISPAMEETTSVKFVLGTDLPDSLQRNDGSWMFQETVYQDGRFYGVRLFTESGRFQNQSLVLSVELSDNTSIELERMGMARGMAQSLLSKYTAKVVIGGNGNGYSPTDSFWDT